MTTKLLRVATGIGRKKCFVASVRDGRVSDAAPFLTRYIGLTEYEFRELCRQKAWTVEEA